MEHRWKLAVNAEGAGIRGQIEDQDGRVRPFASWIALLAAMQELTREAARGEAAGD